MFNLFKEMYFEVQGYDIETMKKERIEMQEEKKKEQVILSKMVKHIIRCAGVLFLLLGTIIISTYFENRDWINVIKYIFMIVLDIASMILVTINKKNTEIAGIICSAIFVILNMILPAM